MWIAIDDDTGGGRSITGFSRLYMECPSEEAELAFELWTGQEASRSTPEYGAIISMKPFDSLRQASAAARGCDYDREIRRWIESPGGWRPHEPFEPWLSRQLLNPEPSLMRACSNDWDKDRDHHSAVASFALIGSLLLPSWLADRDGSEPLSDTAAASVSTWSDSLADMAERALWSPRGPEDRAGCHRALRRSLEALSEAPPLTPEDLDRPHRAMEGALTALLGAGDPGLTDDPLALALLLCETRMSRALGALLASLGHSSKSDLANELIRSAGLAGFPEGLLACENALRPEPRRVLARPKNV